MIQVGELVVDLVLYKVDKREAVVDLVKKKREMKVLCFISYCVCVCIRNSMFDATVKNRPSRIVCFLFIYLFFFLIRQIELVFVF